MSPVHKKTGLDFAAAILLEGIVCRGIHSSATQTSCTWQTKTGKVLRCRMCSQIERSPNFVLTFRGSHNPPPAVSCTVHVSRTGWRRRAWPSPWSQSSPSTDWAAHLSGTCSKWAGRPPGQKTGRCRWSYCIIRSDPTWTVLRMTVWTSEPE